MSTEQIQNQAIATYNKNLEFLKTNEPELYKNLELFGTALNMGKIKPIFDLQYTNGYFDLKDLNTNQFLYGKNSLEISKQVVDQNLNFDPDKSSFKTFYEYSYNDFSAKSALESDILAPYTLGNAPVVNFVNKNLNNPQKLERIEKFIIFGLALGLHFPIIHEKLKSKVYLIVEPNLEFFRLSLFVTDYEEIAKESKIFFSIAQNQEQFRTVFDKFYGEFFIFNHYFKFLKFSDSGDEYIKTIQNFLVSQAHYLYSYDRTFLSISRTNSYIAQNFKVLNIKNKKSIEPFKKPILFLAAGPSLQYNIDFVKKNKNKFIIVAIYATLPILERNNIKPDIITQYDEQDKQVLNTLEKLNNPSFFNDSLFIFSSHINAKLMDVFPKDNIFTFQAMFELKENFGMLTSPSIGELTYAILLMFDSKEIYLLGLDFALDVETGASHMEGHSGSGAFNKLKEIDDSSDKNYSFRKNTILVKGNFINEVKSVPVFKTSIDTFSIFTSTLKNDTNKVYNLSNGAYLEGAEPLKIEEINLSSFQDYQKDILKATLFKSLEEISEKGYNEKDLEKINLKLSSAKKLKKHLEQFQKIKKYKEFKDYENNLINLIHNLLFEKTHCSDLQSILINYCQHTIHFIFHLIALDNGVDKKKYIYEINKNLCTQLHKIINTYVVAITYSSDEDNINRKKLNKFIKEYSITSTIYSEPFFKELAETAPFKRQKTFKKDSIGFFATEENLKNKNFIEYIKEILKRFDNVKLKIFYFFDYQKTLATNTLKKENARIELIQAHKLENIAHEIEFWIETSDKTINIKKVNDLILNNYDNIYSSFFEDEKYLELKSTLKLYDAKDMSEEKSSIKDLLQNNYVLPNNNYFTFANEIKEKINNIELLEDYKEEFIGFFAFEENLSKHFISNIFKIAKVFPNAKFTIFYFNEEQKKRAVYSFMQIVNRLSLIEPKNIKDIVKNCEVWVQNKIKNQSLIHSNIYKLIQSSTLNIFPAVLDEDFELINSKNYKNALIDSLEEKIFSKQLNKKLDINRLQKTTIEDSFGFLATEDNLKDKDFIKLVYILLDKFPQIKFKAFYFNDEQKNITSEIFSTYNDRFEFIIPRDIYDMVENISTYLYSFIKGKIVKSETYYKVWRILNQNRANLFKLHLFGEISEEEKYSESLNLIDNSKSNFEETIVSKIFANDERYNEFIFLNSLNMKEINTIKNSFCKKTIGVILHNQNLIDNEFMSYIDSLSQNLIDIKFNIFYINDKAKDNFSLLMNTNKNISLKKINSITEIIENVEILITNTQSSFDNIVYNKLESILKEVFIINFTKNKFKLDDFDNILNSKKFINFITKNTTLENIDINFLNKTNGNPYKIQNELNNLLKNSEKIDLQEYNDNFYNYIYFNLIKNILNNPDTKKLYLNQKIYRDK